MGVRRVTERDGDRTAVLSPAPYCPAVGDFVYDVRDPFVD